MKSRNQIEDNPALLELMLNDIKNAPKLYQPEGYWLNYAEKLILELKRLGLKNCRQRKNSIITSFAFCDIDPIDTQLRDLDKNHFEGFFPPKKHILFKRFLRLAVKSKSFMKFAEKIARFLLGITLEQKLFFLYQFAKHYGITNKAKSISNLSDSLIGSPKNILKIEDNFYTHTLCRYYIRYAYTCKFIDYNSISSIMEIGSGGGGQIEILKKLYPHLTIFLFDIPPQLYVCEQYLKSVFPDMIVSYEETRTIVELPTNSKGKIFIFASWQLPRIKNLVYDLFWNSESFDEMDSRIVLNYLKFVNTQTQKFVFLQEVMEQNIPPRARKEHYFQGLKNFELVDYSISLADIGGLGQQDHICAIWKKKKRREDKQNF